LEKTIIIDNLAENFNHTTPNNGIWVESWYDDMDDTILDLLLPFLKEIVDENVSDVRKLLTREIKEKVIYRCLEEGKYLPSI
jgi:TFIIF-interacting CTD phosphatase-like protein